METHKYNPVKYDREGFENELATNPEVNIRFVSEIVGRGCKWVLSRPYSDKLITDISEYKYGTSKMSITRNGYDECMRFFDLAQKYKKEYKDGDSDFMDGFLHKCDRLTVPPMDVDCKGKDIIPTASLFSERKAFGEKTLELVNKFLDRLGFKDDYTPQWFASFGGKGMHGHVTDPGYASPYLLRAHERIFREALGNKIPFNDKEAHEKESLFFLDINLFHRFPTSKNSFWGLEGGKKLVTKELLPGEENVIRTGFPIELIMEYCKLEEEDFLQKTGKRIKTAKKISERVHKRRGTIKLPPEIIEGGLLRTAEVIKSMIIPDRHKMRLGISGMILTEGVSVDTAKATLALCLFSSDGCSHFTAVDSTEQLIKSAKTFASHKSIRDLVGEENYKKIKIAMSEDIGEQAMSADDKEQSDIQKAARAKKAAKELYLRLKDKYYRVIKSSNLFIDAHGTLRSKLRDTDYDDISEYVDELKRSESIYAERENMVGMRIDLIDGFLVADGTKVASLIDTAMNKINKDEKYKRIKILQKKLIGHKTTKDDREKANEIGRQFLERYKNDGEKADALDLEILRQWMWQTKRCSLGLKVENHIMLILNGGQRAGKSTAAVKLTEYLEELRTFDGVSLLADERRTPALSQSLVAIWDEMAGISKADINTLKQGITGFQRSYRPMGTNATVQIYVTLSWIATTNEDVALLFRDTTGARRFYQIEVPRKCDWKGINEIDYEFLWKHFTSEKDASPIKKLKKEMRRELDKRQSEYVHVDSVSLFIKEKGYERVVISSNNNSQALSSSASGISFTDIMRIYVEYCKEQGAFAVQPNVFRKRIEKGEYGIRFTKKKKKNLNLYFVEEIDDEEDSFCADDNVALF